MRFYLSDVLGGGTILNPWRARGFDSQPGARVIDLRPDCTVSAGRMLLGLPVAQQPAGSIDLGDDPLGNISAARRNQIGSALGITLQSTTVRRAILELLSEHARTDGTRWRPLRPGRDRMWRLHLGDLVWTAPDISGGASYSEAWPSADNAALTDQLTWTEHDGSSWVRDTNTAAYQGAVLLERASAAHDHGTDDFYVQATLVAHDLVGGSMINGPMCRHDGSSTMTYYAYTASEASGVNEHRLYKVVADSFSILETDTDDVVNGEVLKVQADGSTVKGFIDGTEKSSVTDTAVVDRLRGGLSGYSDTSAGNLVRMDNYSSADLAAAAATPRRRALMGVGT